MTAAPAGGVTTGVAALATLPVVGAAAGEDVPEDKGTALTVRDGGSALALGVCPADVVAGTGDADDDSAETEGELTAGDICCGEGGASDTVDVPVGVVLGAGIACATDDITSAAHSAGESTIATRRIARRPT